MKFIQSFLIRVKALLGMPEAVLAKKILSANNRNMHIYGMGIIGRDLMQLLKPFSELDIVALYDSKAEYNPFVVMEREVLGPDELKLTSEDTLVVASVKFEQQILQQLGEQVSEAKKITVSGQPG